MFDDLDELDAQLDSQAQAERPMFVAWYSGGYRKKDGEALLAPVTDAVKAAGYDAFCLHFPNEYGMTEEGMEPWPKYVDRLVEEIDGDPERRGRPMFLFGHSRGHAPALSVATRLGPSRVLKVFVAASGGTLIGDVSPFQRLSEGFKVTGDIGLLEWFVSLNPGNMMMEGMLKSVKDGVMKPEDSPFLNDLMTLMRVQYKDAMYPDMTRDIKKLECPIVALGPRYDPGAQREAMKVWEQWTDSCVVKMLDSGHMDCLRPKADGEFELLEVVLKEIARTMKQRSG